MDASHIPTLAPMFPMLQMQSFNQQLPPHPLDRSQTDSNNRSRQYKSRSRRPCDFCRYKKAACHLDGQPPCELCTRYNKDCTFVESPAKRRRPNGSNGSLDASKSNVGPDQMIHVHEGSSGRPYAHRSVSERVALGWEDGFQPFSMPGMDMASGTDFAPFDPALYEDATADFDAFEPLSSTTATTETAHSKEYIQGHQKQANISPFSQFACLAPSQPLSVDTTSGEPSLDNQASSNAQLVGISGESDPFLLSRYRYDQYNEASFQSIRMRKMSEGSAEGGTIPTFFTIAHNALAARAQPVENTGADEKHRSEVEAIVSDDVGKRLIRLFYKYVQPYFPLLTRDGSHERDETGVREPKGVPTCILAAIYGHALPYAVFDEQLCVEVYTPPSADALFRIAWLACQPLLHTPSLAILRTLLLLVQRRPTNKHVSDTPVKWVMMATAVSIAQALGINRDPSDWPLPSWEIQVRKRLGWATFVQDKWLALNFGRSSHIQADDWDLQPLSEDDFADANWDRPEAPAHVSGQHFVSLCELTVIVDDIMHDLFSLKATKALQGSLDATLEVAKPLRIRLTAWFQALPAGSLTQTSMNSPNAARRINSQHELDGTGSLHLAYITAKIELFRAMLRPQVTDANMVAISALRTGALAVAREVVDFLEGLHETQLEAFWASYARTNFTIASSFMLLLFVTSPTDIDARECLTLLNAWRSLLRIKSRSCDMLNLALLRLDGVFVAGVERLIELSPSAALVWSESQHAK